MFRFVWYRILYYVAPAMFWRVFFCSSCMCMNELLNSFTQKSVFNRMALFKLTLIVVQRIQLLFFWKKKNLSVKHNKIWNLVDYRKWLSCVANFFSLLPLSKKWILGDQNDIRIPVFTSFDCHFHISFSARCK